MHRVLTLMVGAASGAEIRTETLHNREFTVVPVIAIVEGVLRGANSVEPEFAPASEFGKFPSSWDGRPVVLRHPQISGVFVSANLPQIFEDYNMGFMFNTRLDGKKLKTEAWIDNQRVAELGGEFQESLTRLQDGEIIDVSVGVFLDTRAEFGTHDGKQYAARWENVVPDHLAILPDQKGACTVADGCGTNRVAVGLPEINMESPVEVAAFRALQLRHAPGPSCCDACAQGEPCMTTATSGDGGGAPAPTPAPSTPPTSPDPAPPQSPPAPTTPSTPAPMDSGTPETLAQQAEAQTGQLELLQQFAAAALGSDVTLRDAQQIVYNALPERLGVESWACDILAMTADVAVFYCFGEPNLRGFHQIKYSVSNEGVVTFAGDPEPVNLMTRILPRQTVDVNSGQQQQQEDGAMAEDTGQGGNQPAPVAGADGSGTPAPAAPVVNAASPQTIDAFLETVPAELRSVFSEGLEMRNSRKNALITSIRANSRNRFTEDELKGFDLKQLENLAAIAEVPSYEGLGMPATPVNVNQGTGLNVNSGLAAVDVDYLSNATPQGQA